MMTDIISTEETMERKIREKIRKGREGESKNDKTTFRF